jgi:diacylglycerol kinase (ATP)
MTGGVANTVSRRHAPDSQSRRSGIRRWLMMSLFILGALSALSIRDRVRAYTMRREESPHNGNQEALEMKTKPFRDRLSFALNGLQEAWRRERSLRTQTYIGAIAAVVTIALRPGLMWGGLVALSIALVLSLELANSAIESLIDHLHPDIAPEIKLAKDVIAGAVLVACLGALCVGVLMVLAVFLG